MAETTWRQCSDHPQFKAWSCPECDKNEAEHYIEVLAENRELRDVLERLIDATNDQDRVAMKQAVAAAERLLGRGEQ